MMNSINRNLMCDSPFVCFLLSWEGQKFNAYWWRYYSPIWLLFFHRRKNGPMFRSHYLVLVLLYTLSERRHEYIAISSISSYAQRWSARPHADGHHPCHIWLVLALQCLPPGQTQMETEEAGEPTPGLFGHFVYHYCERSATIGSWVVKFCLLLFLRQAHLYLYCIVYYGIAIH